MGATCDRLWPRAFRDTICTRFAGTMGTGCYDASRHWLGRDQIEQCMPKITSKSEEQKDAEAQVQSFKNELGPFVVAAEATRMAMVFTDAKQPSNPIIFANDSFLSLTGYAREEVLGQSFNFLMAHAADAEALAKIEAEFQGKSNGGCEISYRRKDGSEFWAGLFISPVRLEDGDIVQYCRRSRAGSTAAIAAGWRRRRGRRGRPGGRG
jgi:PAS domain S-box-containing protein